MAYPESFKSFTHAELQARRATQAKRPQRPQRAQAKPTSKAKPATLQQVQSGIRALAARMPAAEALASRLAPQRQRFISDKPKPATVANDTPAQPSQVDEPFLSGTALLEKCFPEAIDRPSPRWLAQATESGRIPSHRVGTKTLYLASELMAAIKATANDPFTRMTTAVLWSEAEKIKIGNEREKFIAKYLSN